MIKCRGFVTIVSGFDKRWGKLRSSTDLHWQTSRWRGKGIRGLGWWDEGEGWAAGGSRGTCG